MKPIWETWLKRSQHWSTRYLDKRYVTGQFLYQQFTEKYIHKARIYI